jgi:hypothetical protein
MTRQPAREKRFTVAWPMPRLAPVSTMVFLGVSVILIGPLSLILSGHYHYRFYNLQGVFKFGTETLSV